MQVNRRVFFAWLVLTGLLLAGSLSLSAGESRQQGQQQTLRQMRESGQILPLEKISAAAKAIKPGEILETELEQKHGLYVYEVEILDDTGEVWEVKLDARTGKLIELESEER